MEKFKQIVEKTVGYKVEQLNDSLDTHKLDSLDIVEFVIQVEDAYDISISDDAASNFVTFMDVFKHIEALGVMKNYRWRVGQVLVNRREDVPYIITKVDADEIEVVRTVKVKTTEFEEWCDGL